MPAILDVSAVRNVRKIVRPMRLRWRIMWHVSITLCAAIAGLVRKIVLGDAFFRVAPRKEMGTDAEQCRHLLSGSWAGLDLNKF